MSQCVHQDTYVTLTIYDILGREVKLLVAGDQTAGKYSISFDASLLPSGVYVYTMTTHEASFSKTVALLK